MINFFYELFINGIYTPIIELINILKNKPEGLYVLIGVFIFLLIIKDKIKIKYVPRILDFLTGVMLILILIVAYSRFSPAVIKFFQTNTSKTPSTQSSPTNSNKQTTPSTTKQQTTPSTTKRLYYSVSCSSCWAEGCSHNGYSYGGYSPDYDYYYRSLCQACRCNNYKAQSIWR